MLLVGLRDNTHCFWFECCLVLPLYISFKKLNVSSWTSFSWIPKNAEKLRIEVIGLQHQPPSLCTRSGEPCILPFLYSGKPLLLIQSYLQCKLCNLHKSHFLKSLTWPDFKTTYCTSANQIIIRHVSFCRILARRMCSGGFHLSFSSPCLFFLLFMTVLQGIRLEIILILIPGVTSASALVRQLCHLNWRDGELVLLLAMLITKTNPVCNFFLNSVWHFICRII